MISAAQATVHVATDWPAFGLFFLGLITSLGGFTAWVLRQLGRNRKNWQDFVSAQVGEVKQELSADLAQLSGVVADLSRESRDQGKAIARIEGRLGTSPAAPMS